MDYVALKNLILAQAGGSAVRVAYAAANDAACATAVNALAGTPTNRDAEFGEWQAWLIRTGTLKACRAAAADALRPTGTRELAQQVVDLFFAKLTVVFYTDCQQFGGAMVTAGLIVQGTLDTLLASLSVTRSRLSEIGWPTVTDQDIARVRSMS